MKNLITRTISNIDIRVRAPVQVSMPELTQLVSVMDLFSGISSLAVSDLLILIIKNNTYNFYRCIGGHKNSITFSKS